ncbi:DUF4760 domain-containing protein [Nodosilinea sp. AN01ver1]|uniref:DUF4760 domain-containing protein n=1 Tax=Nodosilinea sp. AN01ver1 TaxID=3423362 RepID=UPI003D30FD20
MDKNIPSFLLSGFIILSILIALEYPGLSDGQRDNLISTAATIAAAGALLWTANGIHGQYHERLLAKASGYAEAWYGNDLVDSIKEIRKLVREEFEIICDDALDNEKEFACQPINKVLELKHGDLASLNKLSKAQSRIVARILEDKHAEFVVNKIMGFFEQMGQDIRFKVADEHYLKDLFYRIVIQYYELLRKYIEYRQRCTGSPFVFCNFVYMAQTWEKEEYPPRIPSICIRDSILDDEEYKVLAEIDKSSH